MWHRRSGAKGTREFLVAERGSVIPTSLEMRRHPPRALVGLRPSTPMALVGLRPSTPMALVGWRWRQCLYGTPPARWWA